MKKRNKKKARKKSYKLKKRKKLKIRKEIKHIKIIKKAKKTRKNRKKYHKIRARKKNKLKIKKRVKRVKITTKTINLDSKFDTFRFVYFIRHSTNRSPFYIIKIFHELICNNLCQIWLNNSNSISYRLNINIYTLVNEIKDMRYVHNCIPNSAQTCWKFASIILRNYLIVIFTILNWNTLHIFV